MRNPREKRKQADDFINNADDQNHHEKQQPWEKNLSKKYDKETGKTINLRLPEYYAECLQYLADQDNRSQHGELIHLITSAIDHAIK